MLSGDILWQVGIAMVVVCVILGVVSLRLAGRMRAAAGLPEGEIVYSDTGAWQPVEKPLLSRRYGLVGRPDYLVQVRSGLRTFLVPVEVKSRRRPAHTPESHILQLATYCLLVEDIYKQRPPYGLLHYRDATLQIPFTPELRRAVLAASGADARRVRCTANMRMRRAARVVAIAMLVARR